MAINPNTDFTAGAVLTASQQNRFPRGIMAYAQKTANEAATGTTEVQTMTSVSFTAVANRYYEITYFEPNIYASTSLTLFQRIRLNNATGTLYQQSWLSFGAGNSFMSTTVITTFAAGSVTLVGTLQTNTGTATAERNAAQIGFMVVRDIGPA